MKGIRRVFILISLLCPVVAYGGDAHIKATLKGGGETGGFRQGFAASSLWRAGASASGLYSTPRTLFTGSFGYTEEHGRNMMTSMFIEPGYYPVDVLEFTPGSKVRQVYDLSGGVRRRLPHGFSVGGKVDYKATNYAKLKDIRHTTFGMNLLVEPTIGYSWGNMSVSAGYVFRKKSESIDAEQAGSRTGESYKAFLDKGLRYGTMQVWNGDGVHLDEAGVGVFPVKELSRGGAVALKLSEILDVKLQALATRGSVGEKGYIWFLFPGYEVKATVGGKVPLGEGHLFSWEVAMAAKKDRLDEAIMEKVTTGGVTVPRIYGYNSVSDRRVENLSAFCTMFFADSHFRSIGLKANVMTRQERSFLMYPYSYGANSVVFSATLSSGLRFGPVGIDLYCLAGAGRTVERVLGAPEDESLYTKPFRLVSDWDRKQEYMTVPRAGAGMSLKWSLKAVRGLGIIAEASYLHGFNIVLLPGTGRFSGAAGIAYEF